MGSVADLGSQNNMSGFQIPQIGGSGGGGGVWGGAMNTLGGMLGLKTGPNGISFPAPELANIQSITSPEQIAAAQQGVGNSLASQQALLAALQAKGGLNDQLGQLNGAGAQQSAQYNQGQLMSALNQANGVGATAGALTGQQALNAQLARANGIGTQNAAVRGLEDVAAQQQAAGNMYAGIAQGTGPNPARAALNQATQQNIANQAALMAGQRGAGANTGLMARQAAQQGAATQQQAVGQMATQQAQQQLGALSGLTAQQQAQTATQQAIGNLGTTQAQLQQSGIGQQAQIGSGLTNQQQNAINTYNAQGAQDVAQQQAQQRFMQEAQVANTQAQLANAGQLQNAAGAQNNALVSAQGNVNTGNTGLNTTRMQGQSGLFGGLMNGLGAGGAAWMKAAGASGSGSGGGGGDYTDSGGQTVISGGAKGGLVQKMAEGGVVPPDQSAPTFMPNTEMPMAQQGPQSSFGRFLQGWETTKPPETDMSKKLEDNAAAPSKSGGGGSSDAGTVGTIASIFSMFAKGGQSQNYIDGGSVDAKGPHEKAVKHGDSYANDKINAKLSEGEVVIPRSVMQSKDPVKGSAAFVAKIVAKRGKK